MSRSRSHSPTGLWAPQVLDGWQRRVLAAALPRPRDRRRVGFAAERRCGRPVRGGRRAVARRRAARVVPPAGAAGRRDARRPDGDDRRFEREPRPQCGGPRAAGHQRHGSAVRRRQPSRPLPARRPGCRCILSRCRNHRGSRPFVAAALATAGVAWPATLLPTRNTVATGGLCVIVALWPLVVTAAADRRGLARGTGALACVTLAAVVAAGVLGARPSAAALDWQNWNLFGESGTKRTVSLVWSSNYGGIDFPAEKTTVLRITAPHRALYWRATTLDLFTSNRWVETLYTTDVSGGNSKLPSDVLLPPGATARGRWVRQEVDVRAVVDDHVVAASQPMQLAAGAGQRVQYHDGRCHACALGSVGDAPVHGLELRVAADTGPARPVAAVVSGGADAGAGVRPCDDAPVRHSRPDGARLVDLPRRALPGRVAVRRPLASGAPGDRGRAEPVPGDGADRALAAVRRRLRLRRASARAARPAAARRLRPALEARLLPAVRRIDGADAARARDPRPRRRGLHQRRLEERHAGP